jgi:hypothetical protein
MRCAPGPQARIRRPPIAYLRRRLRRASAAERRRAVTTGYGNLSARKRRRSDVTVSSSSARRHLISRKLLDAQPSVPHHPWELRGPIVELRSARVALKSRFPRRPTCTAPSAGRGARACDPETQRSIDTTRPRHRPIHRPINADWSSMNHVLAVVARPSVGAVDADVDPGRCVTRQVQR